MHVLGAVVAVTGAAAGPAPYHHSGPMPGYLLHLPGQVTSLGTGMFLTWAACLRPRGSRTALGLSRHREERPLNGNPRAKELADPTCLSPRRPL